MLSNEKGEIIKLKLTAGKHNIIFCSKIPNVPEIEFIRLSSRKINSIISDKKYNNYIDSLKNFILPEKYLNREPDTTFTMALGKVLPNPNGDYLHELEFGFSYTYYKKFYFYAGANVVFETKKSDPCASNPVMHLFNESDPVNRGSWGNDNGGECYQAKISCTIGYTGYYYLLVRAYWPSTAQTTDLYLYDNLYASDIPITCKARRCDHTLTQELNYFTSYLTGDSRIWVESYETGLNGRILGYNDDYSGSGDFSWGVASRVKKAFSQRIWNVWVTSYSSYNPTGVCDLYTRCKNSTITSSFPNLDADDAIMSAPYSGIYNCISWSGGITNDWHWPPTDYSETWYDSDDLTSFDNYYGNKTSSGVPAKRYSGAWTYTRSGATSSNSMVDLWALNGAYKHGSIRKYNGDDGNNNPHGYDWESKPGGLMRTFHPRNSLNGSSYGSVDKYYKWTGQILSKQSSEFLTLEQSITRGLTKRVNVEFTVNEKNRLELLTNEIPLKTKKEFNSTYDLWKHTWNYDKIKIHSNPRMYAKSEQYQKFLELCKNEGKKILPLIFEKFEQGDYFIRNAIEDLTFGEYKPLMDEVREERTENLYDKDGVFIAPSSRNGWINYMKKVIANSDMKGTFKNVDKNKYGDTIKNLSEDFCLIQNYPNPFNPSTQIRYNIPIESKVSLKIYDILGKEVAVLLNNELKSSGWHSVNWNGKDMNGNTSSSGIYFCRLVTNSQVQTIKILLTK